MNECSYKTFIAVAGFTLINGTLKVSSTTTKENGGCSDGKWQIDHLIKLLGDRISRVE